MSIKLLYNKSPLCLISDLNLVLSVTDYVHTVCSSFSFYYFCFLYNRFKLHIWTYTNQLPTSVKRLLRWRLEVNADATSLNCQIAHMLCKGKASTLIHLQVFMQGGRYLSGSPFSPLEHMFVFIQSYFPLQAFTFARSYHFYSQFGSFLLRQVLDNVGDEKLVKTVSITLRWMARARRFALKHMWSWMVSPTFTFVSALSTWFLEASFLIYSTTLQPSGHF